MYKLEKRYQKEHLHIFNTTRIIAFIFFTALLSLDWKYMNFHTIPNYLFSVIAISTLAAATAVMFTSVITSLSSEMFEWIAYKIYRFKK